MQQHYKHKTILKATRKPEVTFQSSCQRLPDCMANLNKTK